MNQIKPIYLLAGGRGSQNTPIIKAIFKEIQKPVPNIAYVGAANNDDRLFFHFMGAEVKKAGNCQLVRTLLAAKKADLKKAQAILDSADAIFMSGGDVEAGMQILTEKNLTGLFGNLYRQGKLFFGASAGSIMLADEWVRWRNPEDDSTAEMFPCLGLAPVICDTHAEGDDWVELKAALQLKKSNRIGYGIPSGACLKVLPDGTLEAMGNNIVRYLWSEGSIKQMDDLQPVNF